MVSGHEISNHVIDRRGPYINVTLENMYSKQKDKVILDLMDQFEVISSLPNFHRWNVLKSHGVKMDEYFINNGNSQRNKLMRNCFTFSEIVYYEEIKNKRLCIIKVIS